MSEIKRTPAKPTPGPWAIKSMTWAIKSMTPWSQYSSYIHIIPAEDAGKRIGANFADAKEHRLKFCRQIANVPMPPYEFDGISVEEQKANAAFIVRAVNCHNELLEACRAVVCMGSHSPFDTASMIAKTAIAKVEASQ